MHLEKLTLVHFKNYDYLEVEFDSPVTCITGENGAGKTNLIDGIHYLSQGRSFVNYSDALGPRDGTTGFQIQGRFNLQGMSHEVRCEYNGNRKEIVDNGIPCERLSEHLGKYPVVIMAPSDQALILDGSEQRRRYFDNLIAQVDSPFLQHLIGYQQALRSRNSLLKRSNPGQPVDEDLLDVYDQQLVDHGEQIANRRNEFVKGFSADVGQKYEALVSRGGEEMTVSYQSDIGPEDFYSLLKKSFSRDLALQRTTRGIHRDDFLFLYNGNELRKRGSQGQQKSFLIALKLANFEWVERHKGFKPILLLDDVFDKLDDDRIHHLMQLIAQDAFGQLFITDARPERSRLLMEKAGVQAKMIGIIQGTIGYAE